MGPSSFDERFFGCPRCDWPLNPFTGEFEDSGGVTCACGGFVPLPDPPQPGQMIVAEFPACACGQDIWPLGPKHNKKCPHWANKE